MTIPICSHAGSGGLLLFSTDYVTGGYSKSNGDAVVQANVDYEFLSGVYTGLWVSPVDFNDAGRNDHSNIEFTPYLGWGGHLNPDWRIDSVITHYVFDDKIFGRRSDYNEIYVRLDFKETITARVTWSPDYYNRGKSFFEYELSGRYPLTDVLEISAGIGFSDSNNVLEYNYVLGNVGVSWYYHSVTFDLRIMKAREMDEVIHPVDQRFEPRTFDSEVILSISYAF